ncbi:2Fe-2S iron-sulfur cluster-binding protein [Rhodococcus sp. ACPA1]|uniref:2Fe-2S iron-sulfur cluster-binding protein n=1 Tax=Rhodococcus sp. ACPA1 TaxID=2028572 RepID=UPI000BB1499C|nr:2Fe-2S iron-sulfur cluster-binding protein [Rhodococcus sp. ACPA1]PBC51525.1 ferredoxin [Rhodococcus sp. ACPA1]
MSETGTVIGIKVTDRDGNAHTTDWEPGQSLMEALRDNDFPILASCGGNASCATCHVFLPKSVVERLGERSEDELELLEETEDYDPERSRLACQVRQSAELNELDVVIAPEED